MNDCRSAENRVRPFDVIVGRPQCFFHKVVISEPTAAYAFVFEQVEGHVQKVSYLRLRVVHRLALMGVLGRTALHVMKLLEVVTISNRIMM